MWMWEARAWPDAWNRAAGAGQGRAHHAVLRVQHVGLLVVPLEQRPVQPQALQLLVLDYRPQLLVVPKKDHLGEQTGMGLTPQAYLALQPSLPSPAPAPHVLPAPRQEATATDTVPAHLLNLREGHQGDEGLGLRGHARLVHEDLPDVQVLEAGRGRTRARAQDDPVPVQLELPRLPQDLPIPARDAIWSPTRGPARQGTAPQLPPLTG